MVMQEVFEKLQSLQEVLSKKFEVQNDIAEIPKVLATKTELLSRMKKSFVDKSQEHRAKNQFVEELRKKSIEAEAAREKFESQMDQIQTQREYEALDKEIKDSGEREQDLRRDLQKEEQLLGEMKVGLEKEEAMIHKQEEEVQKEQAKIKEALHDREKQLKSLEKKEKLITPGLDEEILFKFEHHPQQAGPGHRAHRPRGVQRLPHDPHRAIRERGAQGRGHHVLPLLQPHSFLPGGVRRGAGDGGGRGGSRGGGRGGRG